MPGIGNVFDRQLRQSGRCLCGTEPLPLRDDVNDDGRLPEGVARSSVKTVIQPGLKVAHYPFASRVAVRNIDSSIQGVSFFVFVFWRLGWYDAITAGAPGKW